VEIKLKNGIKLSKKEFNNQIKDKNCLTCKAKDKHLSEEPCSSCNMSSSCNMKSNYKFSGIKKVTVDVVSPIEAPVEHKETLDYKSMYEKLKNIIIQEEKFEKENME